jgi:hypothetical protein
MFKYDPQWHWPSADDLPCSDDTPVDNEQRKRYPTPEERIQQAEQRAMKAEQRAQMLAERLRSLGLDPDSIS